MTSVKLKLKLSLWPFTTNEHRPVSQSEISAEISCFQVLFPSVVSKCLVVSKCGKTCVIQVTVFFFVLILIGLENNVFPVVGHITCHEGLNLCN